MQCEHVVKYSTDVFIELKCCFASKMLKQKSCFAHRSYKICIYDVLRNQNGYKFQNYGIYCWFKKFYYPLVCEYVTSKTIFMTHCETGPIKISNLLYALWICISPKNEHFPCNPKFETQRITVPMHFCFYQYFQQPHTPNPRFISLGSQKQMPCLLYQSFQSSHPPPRFILLRPQQQMPCLFYHYFQSPHPPNP